MRLGFRERLVALEELLDDVGHRPKVALRSAYTTQVAGKGRLVNSFISERAWGVMTNSVDIRAHIVDVFRRDLIGPGAQDADLANERLNESPSRWYLTGFLAPAEDALGLDGRDDESDPSAQEEMEIDVEEPDADGAGGAAADNEEPEAPNARRRFLPSSIGLTVLLDPDVKEIEARISWGDYRTEPPLPEDDPSPGAVARGARRGRQAEAHRAAPGRLGPDSERASRRLPVRDGRGGPIVVPESAAEQRRGGGLVLETHSRLFSYTTPDGKTERVRALTVFLVNRRATVHRFYADVSYAFQARLELVCETGFRPRRDLSGYRAQDWDLRIADLHYRDMREWAVGRNAAAGWDASEDARRGRHARVDRSSADGGGRTRCAERRRRAQGAGDVRNGGAGAAGRGRMARALRRSPGRSASPLWALDRRRAQEARRLCRHRRRETGERLIAEMETAKAGSPPASIFSPGTPERGRPSAS